MKQMHERKNIIYSPDDSVEAQGFDQMHLTYEKEKALFWKKYYCSGKRGQIKPPLQGKNSSVTL